MRIQRRSPSKPRDTLNGSLIIAVATRLEERKAKYGPEVSAP